MRGDDDLVVPVRPPVGVPNLDAVVASDDCPHRGLGAHCCELLDGPLDVGAGATDDGAPCWRSGDRQQTVVVEELEQVARGIHERGAGRARPHTRDDWHHEVLNEVARVAALAQEGVEGARVVLRLTQETPRGQMEPLDLGEHSQVRRIS